MRASIIGLAITIAFALISQSLSYVGMWLELNSSWPGYWLSLLFSFPGWPAVYFLDNNTLLVKILILFGVEGGASGVFLAIWSVAFIVWWSVISLTIYFWPNVRALTRRSRGTAEKRGSPLT